MFWTFGIGRTGGIRRNTITINSMKTLRNLSVALSALILSACWSLAAMNVVFAGQQVKKSLLSWEPASLDLTSMIGLFTFGDLPGITKITYSGEGTIAGFDLESMNDVTDISFPNLLSVDPSNIQGGGLYILTCPALLRVSTPKLAIIGGAQYQVKQHPLLRSIDASSLTTIATHLSVEQNASLTNLLIGNLAWVGGSIQIYGCTSIKVVDVHSLTNIGSDFNVYGNTAMYELNISSLWNPANGITASGNTALTNVLVAGFSPVAGFPFDFSGGALYQDSVDAVLARCVANASFTSGSLNLSGGANSAPSPAGVADMITLSNRGVTVTINP